jgi:hypothetical protein
LDVQLASLAGDGIVNVTSGLSGIGTGTVVQFYVKAPNAGAVTSYRAYVRHDSSTYEYSSVTTPNGSYQLVTVGPLSSVTTVDEIGVDFLEDGSNTANCNIDTVSW